MSLLLTKLSILCAFEMVKFRVIYIVLSYLYIVSTDGSFILIRQKRGAGGGWGYAPQNGPETWKGTCQTGKKQSPIDIKLGAAIVKNFPPFVFNEDYKSKHRFYAKNNGHTIYVALEDDSIQPVIHGGGLRNKFIFEQLHLHWESEHEFDGKRADLEMHLVHFNSKYGSFEEASTKPDGIVVLAVIFNESEETNGLIEEFFAYILEASITKDHSSYPAVPDNSIIEKEKEEKVFALKDLLPNRTSRFFRYEGSLTTPGCGEVVQWTIFVNRLPVPSTVLEVLKNLQDHEGNVLSKNFRPPQKLNERDVYIQMDYDGRPTPEFEEITLNGCNRNAIISIQILHCVLFVISRLN